MPFSYAYTVETGVSPITDLYSLPNWLKSKYGIGGQVGYQTNRRQEGSSSVILLLEKKLPEEVIKEIRNKLGFDVREEYRRV